MSENTIERWAEDYPNRAHRGAFWKGVAAAKAGEPESSCPYPDHRTDRGSVTFARSFLRAWRTGWRMYHEEKS